MVNFFTLFFTFLFVSVQTRDLYRFTRSARTIIQNFSLTQYHNTADISEFMHALATRFPNISRVIEIGRTHENRPIEVMEISSDLYNTRKPSIWLDGTLHAREWTATAVATNAMSQLVQGHLEPKTAEMISRFTWYIAPCINPDGYEYSFTKNSMWRKNRRPTGMHKYSWGQKGNECYGVDLNRNWGLDWGGVGTSTDPCSITYGGTHAYSEPEVEAMKNFILARTDRLLAYFSFHSYGPQMTFSWGYKRFVCPPDIEDLRAVVWRAANKLRKQKGTSYQVGTAANAIYPCGGCSDDWAKGVAGIKYSILVELPLNRQFAVPEEKLGPIINEVWIALEEATDEMFIRHQNKTKLLEVGKYYEEEKCTIDDTYFHYPKNQTDQNLKMGVGPFGILSGAGTSGKR